MSKFVSRLKKCDDFVCFPKGALKDDVANAEVTLGLKFAKEYFIPNLLVGIIRQTKSISIAINL